MSGPPRPRVVILCGGKGTRIRRDGEATPKVLFEIGGLPIVAHIMRGYRAQGFDDFVLCLGHRGEVIARYFQSVLGARCRIVEGCDGRAAPAVEDTAQGWTATLLDTGEATPTGGRIAQAAAFVGGETFMATYGDGVAAVDLNALLGFHRGHGRLATVTVVRPQSQFGVAVLDAGGAIRHFREKPRLRSWINGGFFVFEPGVVGYLAADQPLEEGPFRALAAGGQMMAYRHAGFWACMDTYKDLETLNDLWDRGRAAWKLWN